MKISLIAFFCLLSYGAIAQNSITAYISQNGDIGIKNKESSFCITVSPDGKISNVEVLAKGTIAYDFNGRLSRIGAIEISYDFNGRIDRINNESITYDFDGLLSQIGATKITYDINHRIDKVGSLTITYDLQGRIEMIGNS